MPNGTIKKVVTDRGFGFIKPDHADGRKGDIFFHCSALPDRADIDEIKEGDRVSFEMSAGDDGRERAGDVRML